MSIESQAARQLHQVLIGIRKREQTMQSASFRSSAQRLTSLRGQWLLCEHGETQTVKPLQMMTMRRCTSFNMH